MGNVTLLSAVHPEKAFALTADFPLPKPICQEISSLWISLSSLAACEISICSIVGREYDSRKTSFVSEVQFEKAFCPTIVPPGSVSSLTGQELKTLLADGAPIVTVVYGRTRLMLLHHCPARTALGLKKGHAECRMCDEGHPDALAGQVLEDRKGYRFPLLRQRLPEGCLVQLMNALPTDNIYNAQCTMHNAQLKAVVLTTEDAEETEEVLRAFMEGRKTNAETTSGHWKRAVE